MSATHLGLSDLLDGKLVDPSPGGTTPDDNGSCPHRILPAFAEQHLQLNVQGLLAFSKRAIISISLTGSAAYYEVQLAQGAPVLHAQNASITDSTTNLVNVPIPVRKCQEAIVHALLQANVSASLLSGNRSVQLSVTAHAATPTLMPLDFSQEARAWIERVD